MTSPVEQRPRRPPGHLHFVAGEALVERHLVEPAGDVHIGRVRPSACRTTRGRPPCRRPRSRSCRPCRCRSRCRSCRPPGGRTGSRGCRTRRDRTRTLSSAAVVSTDTSFENLTRRPAWSRRTLSPTPRDDGTRTTSPAFVADPPTSRLPSTTLAVTFGTTRSSSDSNPRPTARRRAISQPPDGVRSVRRAGDRGGRPALTVVSETWGTESETSRVPFSRWIG